MAIRSRTDLYTERRERKVVSIKPSMVLIRVG